MQARPAVLSCCDDGGVVVKDQGFGDTAQALKASQDAWS